MKPFFGATKATWRTYMKNGWGADMLPVVSDPDAKIDPTSKLKSVGKTPSVYTPSGTVVGLLQWPSMAVTQGQLDVWSEKQYGISIRCGKVVAFDCDCDDAKLAETIRDEFELIFGEAPVRRRANAPRWLAVMRISEPIPKCVAKFPGDSKLEVLCDGQQFVAEGVHPTGYRYEWDTKPVLASLPEVSPDSIYAFLEGLKDRYGAALMLGRGKSRPTGETVALEDPLADWLRASGYVHEEDHGVLHITCPWEDQHSSDTSVSATSYFTAGLNGQSTPGFKCMHAHCAHRTYDDLLSWAYKKGFQAPVSGDFPELPAVIDEDKEQADLLGLISRNRDQKTGLVNTSLPTVMAALRLRDYCGVVLAYDTFTGNVVYKDMLSTAKPLRGDQGFYTEWKVFGDSEAVLMRARLEHEFQFKPISKEMMRDAVNGVALGGLTVVDTMQEYIGKKLPRWDGKKRVEKFFSDVCGAEASEYTKALGRYVFAALFGRAFTTTGIKADITPILIGKQGTYKSTLVAALALKPGTSREVPFLARDDDMRRLMRGASVVEIPELSGVSKRDVDEVKFFLSLTEDSWVPKYQEAPISVPRRCVFFATTNNQEVLFDPTGSRRFAPVETGLIDIERAREMMPQLWAEGREIFVKEGIPHKELERLAKLRAYKYEFSDPWIEAALNWIDEEEKKPAADRVPFTTGNILTLALGVPCSRTARGDSIRLNAILRSHGFVSSVAKIEGKSVRVWRRA